MRQTTLPNRGKAGIAGLLFLALIMAVEAAASGQPAHKTTWFEDSLHSAAAYVDAILEMVAHPARDEIIRAHRRDVPSACTPPASPGCCPGDMITEYTAANQTARCQQPDCILKYWGARNFFNKTSLLCEPVRVCPANVTYDPVLNQCDAVKAITDDNTISLVNGILTTPNFTRNVSSITCNNGAPNANQTECICKPGWITEPQITLSSIIWCNKRDVSPDSTDALYADAIGKLVGIIIGLLVALSLCCCVFCRLCRLGRRLKKKHAAPSAPATAVARPDQASQQAHPRPVSAVSTRTAVSSISSQGSGTESETRQCAAASTVSPAPAGGSLVSWKPPSHYVSVAKKRAGEGEAGGIYANQAVVSYHSALAGLAVPAPESSASPPSDAIVYANANWRPKAGWISRVAAQSSNHQIQSSLSNTGNAARSSAKYTMLSLIDDSDEDVEGDDAAGVLDTAGDEW